MTQYSVDQIALFLLFAAAAVIFVALFFITAPYGRYLRRGWGPSISSTLGWVIMESVAAITIFAVFFLSDRTAQPVAIVFLIMWQAHYLYRSYIFPFRRKGARSMPVAVVVMGMFFNLWNGYLNGNELFLNGVDRGIEWCCDPRFIIGLALFVTGAGINHQSDSILFKLRAPGETGYKIPNGGLYRYVSMPNYLGELVEWCGWALATWTLAGLAFALFTAANLVPRALANHRWYKEQFPDYPKERKAIIPFVF